MKDETNGTTLNLEGNVVDVEIQAWHRCHHGFTITKSIQQCFQMQHQRHLIGQLSIGVTNSCGHNCKDTIRLMIKIKLIINDGNELTQCHSYVVPNIQSNLRINLFSFRSHTLWELRRKVWRNQHNCKIAKKTTHINGITILSHNTPNHSHYYNCSDILCYKGSWKWWPMAP